MAVLIRRDTRSRPEFSTAYSLEDCPDFGLKSREDRPDYRGCNVTEGAVRVLAYSKWLAAGCPRGDAEEFWVMAERELLMSAAD